MSEEEWADEPEVPKKKRGLPGWLWFCGGGCLIAVVLIAIGSVFLWGTIEEMMDADKQWESVGELVEYDQRPEGWTIFGLSAIPGVDGFVFMDLARGRSVNWMVFPASKADETRDGIFGEDFTGGGVPGLSEISSEELSEVLVQGRAIPIIRFTQKTLGTGKQAGAFLDITPDDVADLWLLQVTLGPDSKAVTDEFINEFLAPFHLGPDHVTITPTVGGEVEVKTTLDLPSEEVPEEPAVDDQGE